MCKDVHPVTFVYSFNRDLQSRQFSSDIEVQIVMNNIRRNGYETQLSGGSYTKLCYEQPEYVSTVPTSKGIEP